MSFKMRTVEDAASEVGARFAMQGISVIEERDHEWRMWITSVALEALDRHGKIGTDPLEAINHMRRVLFGDSHCEAPKKIEPKKEGT